MPAKRAIILDYDKASQAYRAVLWADVPAGNQNAYVNPDARSAYVNISQSELQAIRDGLVAEKVVTYQQPSGAMNLTNAQTWFGNQWTEFQAEITADTPWANFGAFLNSGGAWQAATGVPMAAMKESLNGAPCFHAMTPASAFGVSKFHFVMYNGAPVATAQNLPIKVHLVLALPGKAVVTGVASGVWNLQRRTGPTTPPSGAGTVAPFLYDSAQTIPASLGLWNTPAVLPAGGTVQVFNQFAPAADEQALSTLNAPGMASLTSWGGQVIYKSSDIRGAKPLTIRPGQTLEVQQDATAGTGNTQILCVFTVG